MKVFGSILFVLVALTVLLAVPVIVRRSRPVVQCTNQIVMLKGPHGQPIECVCLEGSIATCFEPGP